VRSWGCRDRPVVFRGACRFLSSIDTARQLPISRGTKSKPGCTGSRAVMYISPRVLRKEWARGGSSRIRRQRPRGEPATKLIHTEKNARHLRGSIPFRLRFPLFAGDLSVQKDPPRSDRYSSCGSSGRDCMPNVCAARIVIVRSS